MKIKLIPSTFCMERSCFCYFSYCKQISSIKQQLKTLFEPIVGLIQKISITLPQKAFGFNQPSGILLEIQVNVCLSRPLTPLKFPIILLSWVWLLFETTHFQSSNNSGRPRGGVQRVCCPPLPLPPLVLGKKRKKFPASPPPPSLSSRSGSSTA